MLPVYGWWACTTPCPCPGCACCPGGTIGCCPCPGGCCPCPGGCGTCPGGCWPCPGAGGTYPGCPGCGATYPGCPNMFTAGKRCRTTRGWLTASKGTKFTGLNKAWLTGTTICCTGAKTGAGAVRLAVNRLGDNDRWRRLLRVTRSLPDELEVTDWALAGRLDVTGTDALSASWRSVLAGVANFFFAATPAGFFAGAILQNYKTNCIFWTN